MFHTIQILLEICQETFLGVSVEINLGVSPSILIGILEKETSLEISRWNIPRISLGFFSDIPSEINH